jgi:hypothetical protein
MKTEQLFRTGSSSLAFCPPLTNQTDTRREHRTREDKNHLLKLRPKAQSSLSFLFQEKQTALCPCSGSHPSTERDTPCFSSLLNIETGSPPTTVTMASHARLTGLMGCATKGPNQTETSLLHSLFVPRVLFLRALPFEGCPSSLGSPTDSQALPCCSLNLQLVLR